MKKTKVILALATVAIILAACTTTKVSENPPGSGNYSTNVIVDPRLSGTIDTIKAVNDATAGVNPWNVPINLGLGLVASIAAWVAKKKNDDLANKALLLKTLIQSVDAQDNQGVKDAIQNHATKIGVEGELNQVVKQVGSGIL